MTSTRSGLLLEDCIASMSTNPLVHSCICRKQVAGRRSTLTILPSNLAAIHGTTQREIRACMDLLSLGLSRGLRSRPGCASSNHDSNVPRCSAPCNTCGQDTRPECECRMLIAVGKGPASLTAADRQSVGLASCRRVHIGAIRESCLYLPLTALRHGDHGITRNPLLDDTLHFGHAIGGSTHRST